MNLDKNSEIKTYILEQVKKATLDPQIAAKLLKGISSNGVSNNTDIAVIGLEAKFSNAENKEAFWELLIDNKQSIRPIPDGRYHDVKAAFPESEKKDYFEAGYLDEIDKFDNTLFRLSPQESKMMNPKQRIFLETAYSALEDAGYSGQRVHGSKTGVFVGVDHSGDCKYSYISAIKEADFLATVGNSTSILASRISYILNLKGPSMVIDTACSSSLVSIFTACTALNNHDCDLAIAGGINIFEMPLNDQMLMDIEIQDTKFRVFDEYSKGTAWGEGAGAVILKPLSQALKDHDQIYAVIKGNAINNDGSSNGITAPDQQAQTDLIINAWKKANIDPEQVSYIETHGTGTLLGDPIEIKGITRAFRKYSQSSQFCGIGTIKPNIGHCVGASGIASFIKVVLAIKNRKIPATINFESPNPYINFINSPIYIVNKNKIWDNKKIVAGISSFGFSGTNCHLVLEEAPKNSLTQYSEERMTDDILALSAYSEESLKTLIQNYYYFLVENKDISVYDFAYSNNVGRNQWKVRKAFWFTCRKDLLDQLKASIENKQIKTVFNQIAQDFEAGQGLNWNNHYYKKSVHMISLPTYPFKRYRYWHNMNTQNLIDDGEITLMGKVSGNYTVLEKRVGQIWAETLGYSSIGVNEDFYNQGGDSILASKLVNQINAHLSYHLTIRELFSHPTISLLAQFLERSDRTEGEQIEKALIQPFYNVSESQLGIFLAQESHKLSTAYNLPLALQLKGKVDTLQLERAINHVIERHEILRTNFYIVNDKVMQSVQIQKQLHLVEQSCKYSELPGLYHNFIRVFDLAEDVLIRAEFYHISDKEDDENVLFLDVHHIVADGLSMAILQKEILSLYEGQSLPNLSIQYKDYSQWLSRKSETTEYKVSEHYWKEKLKEGENVAALPFVGEKSAKEAYGKAEFTLNKKDYQNIQEICRKYKITTFSYFVSALNLVLHKYSGENTFSVGTSLHGRISAQLEDMIGMFVNTVPIINQVSRQSTCAEFLTHVNKTIKDVYENQQYPYEKIRQLNSDTLGKELFEIMIAFQEKNYSSISLGNMTVSPTSMGNEESKYPLTIYVFPFEDHYQVDIHYQTKKVSDEEVRIFISNLEIALQKMVSQAETSISQLSLMTEGQISELSKLNEEVSAQPSSTVLDRFLHQVENNADKTAIVSEGVRFTYRNLDLLSNTIAQRLTKSAIQSQDIVGILLSANVKVIISILGILKVGAVFLPLDKESPIKRNLSILEDASAKAVILDDCLELEDNFKRAILKLEDKVEQSDHFERIKTSAESSIYIIYTSGTTGKPKGVEIRNKSLNNYVDGIVKKIGEEALKNSILTSKYNFDLGYTAIFIPLLTGGKLVMASKEIYTNSIRLAKLVEEENVTYLKMTPSLFSILDPKDFSKAESLQVILLGGEEFRKQDCAHFNSLCPKVRFFNHYGPTEATIGCIIGEISNLQEVSDSDYPVIGKPIRNMNAFVLNKSGELLPQGLVGELCIAGHGIAKGYLHSTELTIEKFKQQFELSDSPVYATGDLVRWNNKGSLEFLGRKDEQIKHMGYRINLNEIDGITEQLPFVKQAISLYFHQTIITFVVLTKDSDDGVNEITKYLPAFLPAYLIPNQIVSVRDIPLSGNGKVDRTNLLSLIPQQSELASLDLVSKKEKVVNKAWQEVFEIDTDSYGKNFFEIGGNSLKAIQLIGKLQELFPSAHVQDLYQYPTIKEFVTHLDSYTEGPRKVTKTNGSARLSPIQCWMLDNFEQTINHHNLSFTFENVEAFDIDRITDVINQLIQYHEGLKMKYVSGKERKDSYCLIEDDVPNFIVLEKDNPRSDAKVTENFQKDLQKSLDITTGRNVAVGIESNNQRNKLTIVINQMVVDHISWRIIIEDFLHLYLGEDVTSDCLISKTSSYLDWVNYLTKLDVNEELSYWQSVEKENLPEIVERYPSKGQIKNNRKIEFTLDQESSQFLVEAQQKDSSYSIQNIALTAVTSALSKFSGQDRFCITLGNNGRFVSDRTLNISRTVGRFASLFPVILSVKNSNFEEKVHETARTIDLVPHQGIGYGILKYYARKLEANYQPRISFNFMGDFGNVEGSGLEISTESSVYDIHEEAYWPYYLKFIVLRRNGQIQVMIEYNSEIMDESEVEEISISIQKYLNTFKPFP